MENKTMPILRWDLEKQGDTLKVRIRTEDLPEEKCLPKSFLYQYKMQEEMRALEPYDDVEIYINSRGGDFRSATGIYDALRAVRPWIPMRTLICGTCASAATLLLGLRGPKYITPEGRIFIHIGTGTTVQEDGTETETKETPAVGAAFEILDDVYRRDMRSNMGRRAARRRKHLPAVWAAEEKEFLAEDAVREGLVRDVLNRKSFENGIITERDRKQAREAWKRRGFWASFVAVAGALIIALQTTWQVKDDWKNRPRVESGTVVEMKYIPAFEVESLDFRAANGNLTRTPPMIRTEGWLVTVEADDGRREVWKVNEETYNRLEVGKRVRRKVKGAT